MRFHINLSLLATAALVQADPHHDHSMFQPLACNAGIDSAQCDTFSNQGYDMASPITIPCGQCIEMDLSGEVELQGLNVDGMLLFPASRDSVKITTPYVFVQGNLSIEDLSDSSIPQFDHQVEFHLVGTEDVIFSPHHNQTSSKCASGCNVSKKPIVVAGGSLDINGMRDSCNTWSRLGSVKDAGAALLTPIEAPTPPEGCTATAVQEAFDGPETALQWDGIGAGNAVVENGYFSVSSRSSTQGPRVHLPISCIKPNEPYVLNLKYRYRHGSDEQSAFVPPYIKMVRYKTDGSSDWLSADEVFGRGQTSQALADTWHPLESVIQFSEDLVDPTVTNDLTLYISPFNDADVIDIDDFSLVLASADAFNGRSCDSLLYQSQADMAYPFYATGGYTNVISDGDSPAGVQYLRNTLRASTWSSAVSQDIATDCLVNAAVYEFSAMVRVHAQDPRVVSISLRVDGADHNIVNCPSSSGDWVLCTGKITVLDEQENASSALLHTRVLDDDVSELDMASVKLDYIGGRAKELILEDTSASDCWAAGAKILVTSHTVQHSDSQVATIQSVNADGSIVLENPIVKPITMEDDLHAAVEVALLSRNIKFTAAEDDEENPLHGGHFMVMHTEAPVTQNIVGIESTGFGQQGKLGKYPFHFHMCDNVAGSVLSKNSIRNTKQRGIVVHGSNNLLLEGNILHMTRGHAVMLEDGAEQGNVFLRNMGADGRGVDIRISDDESDPTPSTFWITNPQNTWIGNVAAGNEFSGFWFEVKTRVRGPSAMMHPDMIPNKLPLLRFVDNVSHSNGQGLQTYPQAGYRPGELAVFENHKSFRNRVSGVFFHAGGRLSIDGGYFSDNAIAIDIDMDHSDVISNTVIVGSSSAYQEVVSNMGSAANAHPSRDLCDNPMVGVRLDSYHDGSLFGATGSKLTNVQFSGFGSGSCEGSSVLHGDTDDVRYFDTRNRVEGIQIMDDSKAINLCQAEHQVAIRDVDGSMNDGTPGFFISDTNAIRAHPDCVTIVGACAAFCPNTCLRTMTVMVPSYYQRGSLTLTMTGTLPDGRPIIPIHVQDFQTKPIKDEVRQQDSSHGRLFVTLPAGGSYAGQFYQDGEPVWPLYADLRYEDTIGNCGDDFASFEIETGTPEQCSELIQNGEFSTGSSEDWWHVGLLGLEVQVDASEGFTMKSPNALANGGGKHIGIGQYLDTRCLEEGYIYELTARVKLADSTTGAPYTCNLNASPGAEDPCPTATLRFANHVTQQESWENIGRMTSVDEEWNVLHGSHLVTATEAASNRVFVYINGAPADVDIQVSSVQITRSLPTSSPSSSPSDLPTATPSTAPIDTTGTGEEPAGAASIWEVSNPESVTVFDDATIKFATSEGQYSTLMTSLPYGGDLELTVQIENRVVAYPDAYNPGLLLFLAKPDAAIEDVSVNDNDWSYFKNAAVAWMSEKMYGPSSTTYFTSESRSSSNAAVWASIGGGHTTADWTTMRLERSGGMVTMSYSLDNGASWTNSGTPTQLPTEYQSGPLKIGYRMNPNWKNTWDVTTLPSVVSDGAAAPPADTTGSVEVPTNALHGSTIVANSAYATCSTESCHLEGFGAQQSNIMFVSDQTWGGDVSFQVQLLARPYVGTGYQTRLSLFLSTPDATLDSLQSISSSNTGTFEGESVVATLTDRIFNGMDHTFLYTGSAQDDVGSSYNNQSGGESGWSNLDGHLKLERVGNVIRAYISRNGSVWKQIGTDSVLPANLASSALKVGLRTQTDWSSGYDMTVFTTVN